MDKSWDHPWTTEEMRAKRREWSLAGDAGLLKHLQQFSEVLLKSVTEFSSLLNISVVRADDLHLFVILSIECNVKGEQNGRSVGFVDSSAK